MRDRSHRFSKIKIIYTPRCCLWYSILYFINNKRITLTFKNVSVFSRRKKFKQVWIYTRIVHFGVNYPFKVVTGRCAAL